MSIAPPQDIYQWLSAVSVAVAAYAVQHAVGLSARFVKLETRYEEKVKVIDAVSDQQKLDGNLLAVHTTQLAALASINEKLDALPRREEIDHRFTSLEAVVRSGPGSSSGR
jgi:hypothetical protein